MTDKLKMMFLDTENNTLEQVDVEDSLDAFYDLLCCETIDIVSRKIAGKYYDIICDDEGLLRADPSISAIKMDAVPKPMLFGNLLFCLHDSEGGTAPLSDKDCERIENESTVLYDRDFNEHLVVMLDY